MGRPHERTQSASTPCISARTSETALPENATRPPTAILRVARARPPSSSPTPRSASRSRFPREFAGNVTRASRTTRSPALGPAFRDGDGRFRDTFHSRFTRGRATPRRFSGRRRRANFRAADFSPVLADASQAAAAAAAAAVADRPETRCVRRGEFAGARRTVEIDLRRRPSRASAAFLAGPPLGFYHRRRTTRGDWGSNIPAYPVPREGKGLSECDRGFSRTYARTGEGERRLRTEREVCTARWSNFE